MGEQGELMRVLHFIVAIMLLAPCARAQGSYRSAALGGRSALMGDTGVALGTDGAAPFLNPATVVRVESTLALSVTFISIDVLRGGSWYVPGPVDPRYGSVPPVGADIGRISGNALPSTLCLFSSLPKLWQRKATTEPPTRTGNEKLALCLGTTELQAFDWVGQGYQPPQGGGLIAQASSVRFSWQRFVVAPTYAIDVTNDLAFGASLQGTFTNFGSSSSVGAITTGSTIAPTSSSYQFGASGSDFGLSAIIGGTLRVGKLAIGASVQSPDVSIYGHGNESNYVDYATAAAQASATYLGQGGFHARNPTRMALGIGYDWPHGSVEFDAQLALADGNALEMDLQGTQTQLPAATSVPQALTLNTRYQPTVNASAGIEVFVRKSFSLLGGFATDFSAVDGLGPASLAPTKVNRLLGSFGVGSHSDGGTVLIGAQAYFGWGQALAPNVYANPPVETPTNVQTFGILFVLAGATDLKAITRAVNDVRQLVTPKPTPPTP
jgi:hypothetical protein